MNALPELYAGMGYDVVLMGGTLWRSAGALALASEPSGAVHAGEEAGIYSATIWVSSARQSG